MQNSIFIVGFVIFALYMVGYLYMVTNAHKQQRTDMRNDPEMKRFYEKLSSDNTDYDGHGNWGRFPPVKKKKKSNFQKYNQEIYKKITKNEK